MRKPTTASGGADNLLPSLRGAMADRRRGVHVFSRATAPFISALLTAGRLDELEQLLVPDPKPFWHGQQWKTAGHPALDDVDRAIRVVEAMRGPCASDAALTRRVQPELDVMQP